MNLEELRQHDMKEAQTQKLLDERGVPPEGTQRDGGMCPNCGGPTTETFFRYHEIFKPSCTMGFDRHPRNLLGNGPRTVPWCEDGGEWRTTHTITDCVRFLKSLIPSSQVLTTEPPKEKQPVRKQQNKERCE